MPLRATKWPPTVRAGREPVPPSPDTAERGAPALRARIRGKAVPGARCSICASAGPAQAPTQCRWKLRGAHDPAGWWGSAWWPAVRAGRPRDLWPAAQSARGLASRLRPVCRDTWKENAGARTLVSDALLRGLTSSQPPLAWDGLAGELPNTPGFSSSGKLSTSGASTAPDQVEPRACLAASALAVQTLTAPLVAGVWEGGDVGVTLERALALAQQNGAPPLSAPQLCTHILRTLLYGTA